MKKNHEQKENIDSQCEYIEMLTFAEACQYLKVSKSFLYKATADRLITFFKPTGKMIYFRLNDLNEWLTKNCFESIERYDH